MDVFLGNTPRMSLHTTKEGRAPEVSSDGTLFETGGVLSVAEADEEADEEVDEEVDVCWAKNTE